jgi:hypothetical protein
MQCKFVLGSLLYRTISLFARSHRDGVVVLLEVDHT